MERKTSHVDLLVEPSSTTQYHNQLSIAAETLLHELGHADIAIVLGSGLSNFVNHLTEAKSLNYSQIPFMPQTTVKGHDGRVVVGTLPAADGPVRVLCFAGRVHSYEGWRPYQINFMARMCNLAGVKLFILTNSAGGCLPGMEPGSIMVIRDHIRFTNSDPLLDISHDIRFGDRGFSSQNCYSDRMAVIAQQAAQKLGFKVHEGVYCWTTGPTYETPSEVQAGVKLGGGAFGMSTVPEVLAANAVGMEVFGVSLATNLAAGIMDETLTHEAVTAVAKQAGPKFEKLLLSIVAECKVSQTTSHSHLRTDLPTPELTLPLISAPWQPTLAQVLIDAHEIARANLKQPAPSVAIFLPYGHKSYKHQSTKSQSFLEKLSHVRVLNLHDLPTLSAHTRTLSAHHGRLILGTTPAGRRVCVIADLTIEGLYKVEASFLMQVLSVVGVRSVLFGYVAEPFSSSTEAKHDSAQSTLALLNDVVDRTQSHLPTPAHPLIGQPQYGVTRFSQAYHTAATNFLQAQNISSSVSHYVAFPGPTFPTRAEKRSCVFASESSSCFIGVTNAGSLLAAHSLGMNVFAVAIGVAPFENISNIVQAASAGNTAVENLFAHLVDHVDTAAAQPLYEKLLQLSANDNYPDGQPLATFDLSQENYEEVEEAALYCSSQLNSKPLPHTALVLDRSFANILSQVQVSSRISCADIPHWKSRDVGGVTTFGNKWELIVGKLNGNEVLILAQQEASVAPHSTHAPQFFRLGLATRMLRHLQVKRVLFVAHACSAVSQISTDSVAVISDHINLSGSNPLFGLNEDRWGVRFPDMGNVYDAKWSQIIAQAASDLPVSRAVTAHIPNLALDSYQEGRYAFALGASTLSTGLVPQVIVARHSGLTISAITHISQSVATSNTLIAPPSIVADSQLSQITQMITAGLQAPLSS